MKKAWIGILAMSALAGLVCGPGMGGRLKVGYVVVSDSLSVEDRSVLEWLGNRSTAGSPVRSVLPIPASGLSQAIKKCDVIWIHLPDSASYRVFLDHLLDSSILKTFVEKGGRFLFTGYASFLPHDGGLEPVAPSVHREAVQDDWQFDAKGFQSFRGHPVFQGLFGGAYVWDARENMTLSTIGYFGDSRPQNGSVIGVEKSNVRIRSDRRILIEHGIGKGKTLSAGGLVHFSRPNGSRKALEVFIENSLRYLKGESFGIRPTIWKYSECRPKSFAVSTRPVRQSENRLWGDLPATELEIAIDHPGRDFFDLAGRRALVMGKEIGGFDELWVHPIRAFRDFRVGMGMGNSVVWFDTLPVRAEARPESFVRVIETPLGKVKEILCASLDRPGIILHYESMDRSEIPLVFSLAGDLRWMWPYDDRAFGDLQYGYDPELGALEICDETGDFSCFFGGDVPSEAHIEGTYGSIGWKDGAFQTDSGKENRVFHAAWFRLNADNGHALNLAMAAGSEGRDKIRKEYRDLVEHPFETMLDYSDHIGSLLESRVVIQGPDEEFNRLWKWALVQTDRFVVTTPGLGTGLVAGYSTVNRGWDGGHRNSGRPGYGWYFGRDSEWSGLALDGTGDFETVRNQIRFLAKFQDLSGKIFHELSTSGAVHYDAADATPLFVILVAHHFRASGDRDLMREIWPSVRKAMDFLHSTDTDGDGLIENTDVGHGWVEGGSLFGAHTTLYLAGLWAQTLADGALLAGAAGRKDLAEAWTTEAGNVRNILNGSFWNASDHFYYYGKWKDGTFNPQKTMLPAVPMVFRLLDGEKTSGMLDTWAGNGFSSDWGVRILSAQSPLFEPRGYHTGSVWPLFTGWTALAEYAYGRSTSGFTHIMNTMFIKNFWDKGAVEEVMDGALYRPSGVCPHQCWSETNILHPGVEGMIGWQPDAPSGRVCVSPRFPVVWDSVRVANLRVGNSKIDLAMTRTSGGTRFGFFLREGKPILVDFAPEFPEGTIIKTVRINGLEADVQGFDGFKCISPPLPFRLEGHTEIVFEHDGGVAMVPVVPRPGPGEESAGYRIIRTVMDGKDFVVDLEGRSGAEGRFGFRVFSRTVQTVDGALLEAPDSKGFGGLRIRFPSDIRKWSSARIRMHLAGKP